MSKEAALYGTICACGQRIAFPEYHWPHCKSNPKNMAAIVVKQLPFTKGELAKIASHGPQRDEKLTSKRRGKR